MGVYSGGHGAKGGRLYDWAQVELAALAAPGMARWLLVRRRRHGQLAFDACSGPASTSLGDPPAAGRPGLDEII